MPAKMPTRENIRLYFFIALLTLFTACGLLGSDEKEKPLEPGPRNYTWTVDTTLSSIPSLFHMLWGNSPTDIWVAGLAESLWHYDGQHWEKTGQPLSSSMQGIFGFDSTDVWAINGGGAIYHHNGELWSKTGTYNYPGYELTYHNYIWGSSADEVYIAGAAYDEQKGTQATLLKYDGSKWNYIDLPDKEMSFVWVKKSQKNGLLYITAVQFLPTGDVYKMFTYNGSALKEIYTGRKAAYAYELDGRIYINIGKKIYKHEKDQLELWNDFSQTTHLGNISGRNEKDFFSVASDGLAHYNGTDLKTIYPTNLSINHIFVMEKDVFAIGDSRIIIHGTLNEE